MNKPVRVTTMTALVWLRADFTRQDARAYWRGPHGQIANKVPCVYEYVQHHFSETDHGFWPVPKEVGGIIPADWRTDGISEVRIRSVLRSLWDRIFNLKAVFHDEFNVFDRVLPYASEPYKSLWWTGSHQKKNIGFRAVVFLRARHEHKGRRFANFLQGTLAPAVMAAGASELRSMTFSPGGRFTQWTPDVLHNHPANRRYAGALVIGTRNREEFDKILASSQLRATLEDQKRYCVAIHAYAVENSYPWKFENTPQSSI